MEKLVPANKYNKNIKRLSIVKRIAVGHPILVKNSVAKKLAKISKKLPNNLYLQIDSGYRSRETQKILWQVRYKQNKKKNPNLSEKEIYNITSDLVFDPNKGIPPHSTGGAVDMSLLDKNGKEINLSEPFNKFYNEPQLKSDKISKDAQKLRFLLNKLMLKENFAPNKKEYWHFSYGDTAWAKYYKKKPIYSEIILNKDGYYPLHKRLLYRVARKVWKFVNWILKIQTNY